MTLLAARARPEPVVREAGLRRRRARLARHAAALALVLVVVHLLTGPGQLTQADEGAALAQAQILAAGDGWAMRHPLPSADPSGSAFPIERSVRIGDSFEYVPYAKHPAYPLLLAGAVGVAGESGAVALSIAGAVFAALGAALLARRIDPSLAVPALWLAGVATPLLFYGGLVIAHTLGAAAAAFAVLALTTADGRRARTTTAGAILLALACLLRTEAVLLGGGLALVLAVDAWRRRGAYAPAVAAFGATAAAYLVDPWLQSRVLGGADVGTARISDQAGFLAGRIDAIRGTVFSPADELPRGTLLGMLVLVSLFAAAWLVQRRADRTVIRALLVIGAAAAVARLVQNPTGYVPGLLPAAPVVAAGVLLVRRRPSPPDGQRMLTILAAVSVVFVLAVVATEYSDGSAGPWGGRYFAVGLPLIAPLAAAGLARARGLVDGTTARVAVACLAVVSVALAGVGITASRTSRELRAGLDDALRAQPDGLVVSVLPGTGRFQYEHVFDGVWLETDADGLVGRAPELRAAGIERFTLLTPDPARDGEVLAPEYVPMGEPVTIRTTVMGVTSVLITRLQTYVAAPPA